MKLNRRGDTMVEVLIAILVIGVILVGAYAAVTRSLNTSQDALERSVGTKLVESQIERIKSIAADPARNIFDSPPTNSYFCVDTSLNVHATSTIPAAPGDDNLSPQPGGNYPTNCVIDSLSNSPPSGNSTNYYVSVQRTTPDNIQYTFKVRVRWYGIGERGIQETTVSYRMYR